LVGECRGAALLPAPRIRQGGRVPVPRGHGARPRVHPAPAGAMSRPPPAIRRVVLLHGIWMAAVSMRPMAGRLRAQGFEPEVLGYRSVAATPQAAIDRLLAHGRRGGPAHVVGHSLGGLIAVQALCVDPHVPVARVLCLGSPLCGSGAAAGLARLPLSRLYFGHSAELLLNGCMTWPDRFEVGMIAGSSPHGMGQWFGRFQGEHDGTVAVAETRTPALADHLVLPVSHMVMVLSREVARQAGRFLATGRFDRAAPGA